ncbi:hypothetical protein [Streptomyces tropicalis]|uniref:Uncharacterized protein n=1 Tax=Streptomyces tropicalis TaxID=3034234 RepID=A0ABT6A212_9ACTN|nr:hypothetical protein [Streptomyces tropicalis]MDF3298675.1 hypothetical protein [Streptomyces tropicalis]
MDLTPPLPLPLPAGPRSRAARGLSAPQAHRMLLYCALEGAGVPLDVGDVQAVFDVAELDYVTVQAVIAWIASAGTSGFVR